MTRIREGEEEEVGSLSLCMPILDFMRPLIIADPLSLTPLTVRPLSGCTDDNGRKPSHAPQGICVQGALPATMLPISTL